MRINRTLIRKNVLLRQKSGVTLIELLAVIILLGIIAVIAFSVIGTIISKTKSKADYLTVIALNEATHFYELSFIDEQEDIFYEIDDDASRIDKLVEEGFLRKVVLPQVKDTVFTWDVEHQIWIYADSSLKVIINFDKDNLDITVQQITTSFMLYIDLWLAENPTLPVFNQTYASLTWSSATYVGTSQTNIYAANFWLGYFDYADTKDFDATSSDISDFKVFFKRDIFGEITNEITAVYLQSGSKRAIYFTNDVVRFNTHYSVFLDAETQQLIAPVE